MAVDDSYTKALLHMDGSDGSTTFTDESGKTWTANGNAQIDTAQSKFGGSSGLFDGTGDYIDTPNHSDFFFDTGDFTVDLWVRFSSLTSSQLLYSQYTDGNNQVALYKSTNAEGNKIYFQAYLAAVGKADYNMTNSWAASINVWYHIAIVRSGTSFLLFIDGVSQTLTTTVAIGTNSIPNLSSLPTVGAYSGGVLPIFGWIDELRISKGIARWTANFTPPTSAYAPPSSGGIGFFPFF